MPHRDRVCRSLQITEDQSVGQSERNISVARERSRTMRACVSSAPLTILVQTRSLEAASDSRGPAVEVPYVTPPKSDMQRNGNIGVLRQSTTIKI
ncbi:hypothetical protein Tco_1019349 [Tanacetum coccineum]|uniref:Uncharacterized protein n=1 Tax=Tanacetum coccineum TaxID=301880 RepID=A0ABQ5FX67_9ASTR